MTSNADELRRRAEKLAHENRVPDDLSDLSPEEIRQTLHELQVHQIELTMQNEELRRAQEELAESQERYFDLYDLAPVGYCTISENGIVLEANLTAARLLVTTRGQLVRQPLSRFIRHEDQEMYYRHRREHFKTGEPASYQLRMIKTGGSPFWVQLDAILRQDKDGTPVSYVIMQDIDARKQAEEALEYERTLLRTVIDHLPDAIYVKDTESRRILTNPADLYYLGAEDESEVLGKTPFELYNAKLVAALMAEDRAVLHSGEPLLLRETETTGPDGEERWVLTSKLPLRDSSGRIIGLVGIDRDVTQRHRTQRALLRAEQLAVMGRLAASFAHEINNPLQAVVGCMGLVREMLPPESEAIPYMEVAHTELVRSTHLIRRLRELAQPVIDGGKREAVDLNRMLSQIVMLHEPRTKAERVEVVTHLEQIPEIQGDSDQLRQVLLNLVSNALDAMPKEGTLTLETHQTADPPSIAVTVSDTGVGMSDEEQAQLFRMFKSNKAHGLGLGLYLTQEIVHEHGGYIEVQSRKGEGSTFRVWLPLG